jgi:hypothetical protein
LEWQAGSPWLSAAFTQGMKIPGEASVQSDIIKPAPLDATESRIAVLKVATDLKIEN